MKKINIVTHPLSAYIIKKQYHERIAARQQALSWLATTFPAAFDTQHKIAPLKIGILQDILDERTKRGCSAVSVSKLREALRLFTRRLDYLTALKSHEMRIDLYGNPTSRVSDHEARQAQYRIRKIIHNNISKYEYRNPFKMRATKTKIVTQQRRKGAPFAVHP